MKWAVYKIVHVETGRAYVGVTSQLIWKRVLDHYTNRSSPSLIAEALREYGLDTFKIEVIEVYDEVADAFAAEAAAIIEHGALWPAGFNKSPGQPGRTRAPGLPALPYIPRRRPDPASAPALQEEQTHGG